mmetsp:Transcript_33506/g.94245  ORF Transcript_33506/g.94245 Transcript_33506/m.94245 type:complete len:669 (-) Transcript_33506:53-2059(-)
MADPTKKNIGESLSTGYDEECDRDDEGGNRANPIPPRKPEKVLPYDFASRVSLFLSLHDLSMEQIQDLIITEKGRQHEADIRRITEKETLVRLLMHLKYPGESLGGHLPKSNPLDVSYEDFQLKFDDSQLIGVGGFSKVYQGYLYHTPCAVKKTRAVHKNVLKKLMPSLRKEIEVMKNNNHPNIVGILGTCCHNDTIYIVMQRMEGNLEKYLKANKNISLLRKWEICHDILTGLTWLHQRGILHLDLKLENILFDTHGVMKLTDFGLSAMLSEDAGYIQSRQKSPGNVGHMSPEVIQKQKFDEKADVFSLGIMMWEIFKGYEWEVEIIDQLKQLRIPTRGNLRDVVKRAICFSDLRPSLEKVNWPESLKNLLRSMWSLDPAKRPTISSMFWNKETNRSIADQIKSDLQQQFLKERMTQETGVDFWLENFGHNIEGEQSWQEFKEKLYRFMGIHLPDETLLEDTDTRLMLFLKLALNSYYNNKVSLGDFACVVEAFGPLSKGNNDFLHRIRTTLSNRWFFPDLNQAKTRGLLSGQDDGVFVVRYSSKPGVPFTLSRMKDKKLYHVRIYRLDDGNLRIGDSNAKHKEISFSCLAELIHDPRTVRAYKLQMDECRRRTGVSSLLCEPAHDTDYLCQDPLEELIQRMERNENVEDLINKTSSLRMDSMSDMG